MLDDVARRYAAAFAEQQTAGRASGHSAAADRGIGAAAAAARRRDPKSHARQAQKAS
ncbi:hypothetical protein [Nocardia nova]|uniref:hypothetical protein n=1 Tax=Nocardia nova TaxID=37330 RepID=UPI0025AF44F9|nr:hypothetical protein [Nocardia nova]